MSRSGLFLGLAAGLHGLLLVAPFAPKSSAAPADLPGPVWLSVGMPARSGAETSAQSSAPAPSAPSAAIAVPRGRIARAKARARVARAAVEPADRIATPIERHVEPAFEAVDGVETADGTGASSAEAQHAPAAGEALAAGGTATAPAGGGAASPGGGSAAGAHAGPTRAPGLLAFGSPCAGYFPRIAATDDGEARIDVEVDAQGHVHAARVLVEHPARQGFGAAARECAAHLQFVPARDAAGTPVAGHATLALRFHRG